MLAPVITKCDGDGIGSASCRVLERGFTMSPIPTRTRILLLSAAAGLTTWLQAAPTIDVQPQLTVAASSGQPAVFFAQASGTGTVRFQWRRMGGELEGQTSSSYTIPAATVADSGYYDVVVTDDTGSTTSTPSRLIVAPKNGYPDTLRLDTSFAPLLETGGATIVTLAAGPDGSIYVSGNYSTIAGQRRRGFVRFAPDFALDPAFASAVGDVRDVAFQPDGKLLVGGGTGVKRLYPDGTLDPTFAVSFGSFGGAGAVEAISLQSDGKVLVRGTFDSVNGVARRTVVRLNADGSVDAAFDAGIGQGDTVVAMKAVGSRTVLLGSFYQTGGNVNQLRILNPDGSVVASTPGHPTVRYSSAILECSADGMIYVLEQSWLGTTPVERLLRYDSDAVLDVRFQSVLTGSPRALAVRSDGRLVVSEVATTGGYEVVVLNTDGTVDPAYAYSVASPASVGRLAVNAAGRIFLHVYRYTGESLFSEVVSFGTAEEPVFSLTQEMRCPVFSVKVLPVRDGKWLVSGAFTHLNGAPSSGWARINSDGTTDPSFATTCPRLYTRDKIVVQGDGRILVVGCSPFFARRLLPDGRDDPAFPFSAGTGFSQTPTCVQILPDARIVAGGNHYGYDGESFRTGCVVLLPDGRRDTSFALSIGGTYGVYSMVADRGGGVAIGGSTLRDPNYSDLGSLVRLDRSGGISFPAGVRESLMSVRTMDTDTSGRLVLVGDFYRSGVPSRHGFVRMSDDGSIVAPGGTAVSISEMFPGLLVQNDDKVLVSGSLSSMPDRLIRVGADDTLDSSFRAPDLTSASSASLFYDDDGRLLLSNSFADRDGLVVGPIVRLKPDTMPSMIPTITNEPADDIVASGGTAHLWVDAAVHNGGLGYQWYAGESGDTSAAISGATLPVYDMPALTEPTQVWVRVLSATASVDSRTVTVSIAPRQDFAQWIVASGAPADQRGELDTPAGDGVSNLMKFALGVLPLDAAGAHLPIPELHAEDGQPLAVALVFARNPNVRGIRYALEVSTDLAKWTEAESTVDALGLNPDGTELVRLRELTPRTESPRFLRLKVEAVAP